MCGICGIFSSGNPVPVSLIKSLADTLKHRGPDDEGYLAGNKKDGDLFPLTGRDSQIRGLDVSRFKGSATYLLGHRRLSILDLTSAGHQPFSNAKGTLWIVYNGEVYNYKSLREELKTKGYLFKTHTDTEVVLTAYEEWGEQCLDKLDGMWAFAIFDRRKHCLFGARDRFGVKPMYFFKDKHYFAFASEIKALLKLPFIQRKINNDAAFDFLAFGWIENEEESFFKGIWEVYPGQAFHLDLSSLSLKKWKYYNLAYNPSWEQFDPQKFEGIVRQTKELLFEAVSSHLQSDVPVGSCLSGGLDSSSVVCMVNSLIDKEHFKQVGERQKVFTVCYKDNKRVDESRWAKFIVDKTKTSWYRLYPQVRDIGRYIEDIVYAQDIPFGSASGVIPQYFLMKLVREAGVKVLLDGQGGDELFAGYKGFFLSSMLEHSRHFALHDVFRELKFRGNSPVSLPFYVTSLAKIYLPQFIPGLLLTPLLRGTRREIRYLNPRFLAKYKDRLEVLRHRCIQNLNQSLHQTITHFNFKYLLRYEDRNSMRYSIEARTPFADHRRLIEFAFQVPGNYKIHNGWSKYLLRQAMAGILPEEVRWRKDKLGFAVPESSWLKVLQPIFQSYLSVDMEEFIQRSDLLRDLDVLINNPSFQDFNPFVWRVLIFAIWKKVFQL